MFAELVKRQHSRNISAKTCVTMLEFADESHLNYMEEAGFHEKGLRGRSAEVGREEDGCGRWRANGSQDRFAPQKETVRDSTCYFF
jgi:hypothetical protein